MKELEDLKLEFNAEIIKIDLEEPYHLAMEAQSAYRNYFQIRWQYADEVQRVLSDMKIIISLLDYKFPTKNLDKQNIKKEDLKLFLQGAFLDAVHQMKDKLKLLLLFSIHIPSKKITLKELNAIHRKFDGWKFKDLEEKYSNSELKGINKLQELDEVFLSIVNEWKQGTENEKGIGVSLRKRRHYHHLISPLVNDWDRQRYIGISTLLNTPNVDKDLSDYGKEKLPELQKEYWEKYHKLSLSQCKLTHCEVSESLKRAIEYIKIKNKISFNKGESVLLFNNYLKLKESFEIKNVCSKEKINLKHKQFIDETVDLFSKRYKKNLIAIYLYGDLPRGDFDENSFVYIIFVFEKEKELPQEVLEITQAERSKFQMFNKQGFQSPENERIRFLCAKDGLLLYGKKLIKEKFPNSGGKLSYLLLKDFPKRMASYKAWIKKNPNAIPTQISVKSKQLSYELLEAWYCIIKVNVPSNFSFKWREQVKTLKEEFSKSKKCPWMLEQIIEQGVGTSKELEMLVENAERIIFPKIQKLKNILK